LTVSIAAAGPLRNWAQKSTTAFLSGFQCSASTGAEKKLDPTSQYQLGLFKTKAALPP
jgi:hypothetical protein